MLDLILDSLSSYKCFVCHLHHGWTPLSIYNLRGFRLASGACPAVYLQPNHWWHSLDVWAPLTLIPTYHMPHCCQARAGENRQVGILKWWTMETERQREEEEEEGETEAAVCVAVYFEEKHVHLDCDAQHWWANMLLHNSRVSLSQILISKIKTGSALRTSLNSWIWACSNMENTLELAPSAVLFLAFLGAYWHKHRREMWQTPHDRWIKAIWQITNKKKGNLWLFDRKCWW